MKQRILGLAGISVSPIGVGAWQLGGPLLLDGKTDGHPDLGADHAVSVIHAAQDLGVNFIDTAEQYGAGESERRVGRALQGRRRHWVLSTKFGAIVGDVTSVNGVPSGRRVADVSPARIRTSLENSLRRLGTDYIDVYVYHVGPDPDHAAKVAQILANEKSRGTVRAVGISSNNLDQIRLLHSLNSCDVVQFGRSLLSPESEPLIDFLKEHNIGCVVRGAMAAGKLSGKYTAAAPAFRDDDIRAARVDRAAFARFAALAPLARPGRTLAQAAVRYLLDEPTSHTIILGAKSIDEYRDAVAADALPPLTQEERALIRQLRPGLVQ